MNSSVLFKEYYSEKYLELEVLHKSYNENYLEDMLKCEVIGIVNIDLGYLL